MDTEVQELVAEYQKTGRLNSRLMLFASLESCRDVLQSRNLHHRRTLLEVWKLCEAINERERTFEQKHWLGQLQEYYRHIASRGHSADGNGFKAMLWGCAGRVLLTLNGDGCSVTLIFDETADSLRGGVQGVDGTAQQVIDLLNAAIEDFPMMTADDEVTIAV